MDREEAVKFLNDAARYYETRPTGGEDKAHWSNVYNAKNCRNIAAMFGAPIVVSDDDDGFTDVEVLTAGNVCLRQKAAEGDGESMIVMSRTHARLLGVALEALPA